MFSIGRLDELPFDSCMAKPRRSNEPMVHKHVIFKDPLEEVRYFSSVDPPGAYTRIPDLAERNKVRKMP
jgi:hypothetical protein